MRDGSAPDDGPLDRRGRLPPRRMGDRPLVADRRQPGRHPARVQRGHPRVPLGREGARAHDGLLVTGGLRRDRAAPRDGRRPAASTAASSRGNLLSGEAEETILTVSRTDAERRANPGYRAFLANGFNVTRALVLFVWEVAIELTAAARAARRDVRPRGHRGGIYPLMRGAMCVDRPRPHRVRRADRHDARAPGRVRDLLELRRGRPPLGPRACRHPRGAAQARSAVRTDRARAPVCAATL